MCRSWKRPTESLGTSWRVWSVSRDTSGGSWTPFGARVRVRECAQTAWAPPHAPTALTAPTRTKVYTHAHVHMHAEKNSRKCRRYYQTSSSTNFRITLCKCSQILDAVYILETYLILSYLPMECFYSQHHTPFSHTLFTSDNCMFSGAHNVWRLSNVFK